jgi:2'-5' RNA ligase
VTFLRAFIAIELPANIRNYLYQTGKNMAVNMSDRAVRWVAPENIHLTLRFLGDTAEDKLPLIAAGLDNISQNFQPFTLYLNELGCYPNRKRPRVIWVGLTGDLEVLNKLQSRIEQIIQTLGWPGEGRPFQAHLTIGRVKDQSQARNLDWVQQLEKKEIPVSAVNLIESQLRPSGPVYTIRHSSLLGNSEQ